MVMFYFGQFLADPSCLSKEEETQPLLPLWTSLSTYLYVFHCMCLPKTPRVLYRNPCVSAVHPAVFCFECSLYRCGNKIAFELR